MICQKIQLKDNGLVTGMVCGFPVSDLDPYNESTLPHTAKVAVILIELPNY